MEPKTRELWWSIYCDGRHECLGRDNRQARKETHAADLPWDEGDEAFREELIDEKRRSGAALPYGAQSAWRWEGGVPYLLAWLRDHGGPA